VKWIRFFCIFFFSFLLFLLYYFLQCRKEYKFPSFVCIQVQYFFILICNDQVLGTQSSKRYMYRFFFIYSKYVYMVGYDIRLDWMDDVRIMQIPFQIFNLSPETKNVGILSFYSKYFLSDQWTFERIIW
jgi:hypothetical protein